MGATSIEWTDFSPNPIRARLGERVGHHCEKISPGCTHCYSSRLQPRFGLPQFQHQRGGQSVDSFLDPKVLESVLRRKKPAKFFWCDMTDMFGDWVPDEWIAACFGVMAATPQHTHQVLTKRPERAAKWFGWIADRQTPLQTWKRSPRLHCAVEAKTVGIEVGSVSDPGAWPLPNVWIGASVENQEYADARIPVLLKIPAAVRWVSAEPLLGPVDLKKYLGNFCGCGIPGDACDDWKGGRCRFAPARLSWVVAGGESGHGARPFDVAWARSIVAQCKAAGVPVFVKQLGAAPWDSELAHRCTRHRVFSKAMVEAFTMRLKHSKGGDISEWPADLRVREFPCR